METREHLNTPQGFAEIIEIESSIIKERFEAISKCEDAQKHGIQLHNRDNMSVILLSREFIVNHLITQIFTKYSAGYAIDSIIDDYKVALDEKNKIWERKTIESFSYDNSDPFYSTDEYWEIMQIIALGILLNVKEEGNRILSIRDKVSTPDIILDFLCSYFDNRDYSFNQSIGNKYDGLVKTIKECMNGDPSSWMHSYLRKEWFRDYKRQGFSTSHNRKYNSHRGYWSFESGAIMKILESDDTILKGQQFYPYDMVHWQ